MPHPEGEKGHPHSAPQEGPLRDLSALTDLREKGRPVEGREQALDRRTYVQLLAFGNCHDSAPMVRLLEASGFNAVLYNDLNDPSGIGLLTLSDDPDFFVTAQRELLKEMAFSGLALKPGYAMTGRTYGLGHEEDLEDFLLKRPLRVALNRDWPWAIWYPLRRKGEFTKLARKEQSEILMEHGAIGRAFGKAGLGHDIRLVCNGLDLHDNDFMVGLIGRDLHPLSALVQVMRSTRQTSTYIQEMGPFFAGKAVWQSPLK